MPENLGAERASGLSPSVSSSSNNSNGVGQSDNDNDRKSAQTRTVQIAAAPTTEQTLIATPGVIETLGAEFDPTAGTSDGPAGGDPDAFNTMIESQRAAANQQMIHSPDDSETPTTPPPTVSSPIVIDPNTRNDNTSDGPNGGDPDSFEELTGESSEFGDSDNEGGGGTTSAATLGGLTFGGMLRGLGAGISAGFGAVVVGISVALFPRPVGEGSDIVPGDGTTMNTMGLDVGGEEWGRRNGVGAAEGRRRAHGIKQRDGMSTPTSDYRVDPETGDVIDPEGEVVGNLEDDYH